MVPKDIKVFCTFFLLVKLISALQFQNKTSFTTDIDISKIVYSADQSFLLITGNDSTTFILTNGLRSTVFETFILPTADIVNSVAFASENTYLAIGDRNGGVNLYIAQGTSFSKEPVIVETGLNNQVTSLAFFRDNSLLAAGLTDGSVVIIDVEQRSIQKNLTIGARIVNALAWSPISNDLLVGGGVTNSIVIVFDITTGQEKFNQTFTTTVQTALYRQDGIQFIINTGGIIRLYDSSSQTNLRNITLSGETNLFNIQLSSNSKYLTISGANRLYIYSFETQTQNQQPITTNINSHGLGSTAGFLAVGAAARQIDIYQLCPEEGNFYADTDTCENCQIPCASCVINATFCQSCIQKYFLSNNSCNSCIKGCITCINANQCQTCDTASHFSLNSDNICICQDQYYLDNDNCSLCMPGCINCSQAQICKACDFQNNFILNPDTQKCECKMSFRQQQRQCIACGKGCLQCTQSTCENCDGSKHWVDQNPPGYNCKCDEINHFKQKNEVCSCADNYYPDQDQCLQCPLICQLCDSFQKCTSCKGDAILIDQMCRCQDTKFFNQTTLTCDSCDSLISFCVKCQQSETCQQCDSTLNRILQENKCICKPSYYQEQSVCLPCGMPGCLQCIDTDTCKLCNTEKYWVLDQSNKCICAQHYYEKLSTCLPCIDGCLTCQTSENCQICNQTANWQLGNDTLCYCKQGYYDGGQQICLDCSQGCRECISQQLCLDCYTDKNYILNPQDNETCICKPGYYSSNHTICLQCQLIGCILCSDEDTCTQCYPGFFIKDGHCTCKSEQYIDSEGKKCLDCSSPCVQCRSQNECLSCIDGYELDGYTCQEKGLSILVIILIVVGCLALIGAGVAIVIFCRKKKVPSPLQQQGEYQPIQ